VGNVGNRVKVLRFDEAAMRYVAEKWRWDQRVYKWGVINFRVLWFLGHVWGFGSFVCAQALCCGRVWFS